MELPVIYLIVREVMADGSANLPDRYWKMKEVHRYWFSELSEAQKACALLQDELMRREAGYPQVRWHIYPWESDKIHLLNTVSVTEEEADVANRWIEERRKEQAKQWAEREQEYQRKRAEAYCIEVTCPNRVQLPSVFCSNHQHFIDTKPFVTQGNVTYWTKNGECAGYIGELGSTGVNGVEQTLKRIKKGMSAFQSRVKAKNEAYLAEWGL